MFGQQFGRIDDRLTSLGNGISTLGYELQGNIAGLGKEMALGQNGTNMTIMQTGNNIQAQLAQCCCDSVTLPIDIYAWTADGGSAGVEAITVNLLKEA